MDLRIEQFTAIHFIKKNSTGGCLQDKEAPLRIEPEQDLAGGLPPIKISLGEEDPDTRPDTALTVARIQVLDNLIDVAALVVCNRPEDVKLGRSWHKNFRCFEGNFWHSNVFHTASL